MVVHVWAGRESVIRTTTFIVLSALYSSAVAGTCHTYAPEIAENFLRERDGLEPVEYEKSIDVRSAGVVMVEIAQGYEERATASEVEVSSAERDHGNPCRTFRTSDWTGTPPVRKIRQNLQKKIF